MKVDEIRREGSSLHLVFYLLYNLKLHSRYGCLASYLAQESVSVLLSHCVILASPMQALSHISVSLSPVSFAIIGLLVIIVIGFSLDQLNQIHQNESIPSFLTATYFAS